jgi:hypothetical protein
MSANYHELRRAVAQNDCVSGGHSVTASLRCWSPN